MMRSTRSLTTKQRGRMNAVLAAIRQMDSSSQDIAKFGPLVIAIFAGVHRDVFVAIDDQIGEACADDNGKGWMVRRVRNHPEFGRQLFAGLTK